MGSSELAFGQSSIRAGVRVTLALAVSAVAYLAATPSGAHRTLLLAIVAVAVLDAAVMARFSRRRMALAHHNDLLLTGWNLGHIAVAIVASVLDSGSQSPFVAIFFISVAFAAVSLPTRHVIVVAAADLGGLAAVAAISHQWYPGLIFILPALAVGAAVCASIANARTQSLVTLQIAQEGMFQRLAGVIDHRHHETGTHTERMSDYCGVIARRLGWSAADARRLQLAASMHDVGKLAVPDSVLLKPGPLTPDERRVMERHTLVGFEMLSGSHSELIQLAASIALTHHERVDGNGYPHGVGGEDIPLAGRIVAVADVFDALTSDRVYRPAMSLEAGLRIVREGRGTQFDPAVVDAFELALGEILAIRGETIARELVAA
jgi:HD-GYP domain-containing protein (c-di-GMP phosphodiesterase class II)